MYFLYILYSPNSNKYYVGSTGNIGVRFLDHNNPKSTDYTKRYQPWKLVYKEEFINKSLAIKREKFIKRMKSKKFIEKLIEQSRL